jgi:hypothetical protein
LEDAIVDFPEVRAETRFIVQWTEYSGGTNQESNPARARGGTATTRALGATQVLVYPTNLLAELGELAGKDHPVGLLDPGNRLEQLLKPLGVSSCDLADGRTTEYQGNLAIIGPFKSREEMPDNLVERVETLARRGVGVVWLLPPPSPHAKTQPSYYTVHVGTGRVVVAQSRLVAGLGSDPQAQLNLLHLCRCARNPVSPGLPGRGDPSAEGDAHAAE